MARRIAVILAGDFVAGNAPLILLSSDKVGNNPPYLYWTCALIVMGFMANRLNVSITGLQASAEIYYVPKWSEFAPTVMVITCALLAFPYAVIYLDVLVKNPSQSRWMMKGAVTQSELIFLSTSLPPGGLEPSGLSFKQQTSSRNSRPRKPPAAFS
jgi:hypothetical protein